MQHQTGREMSRTPRGVGAAVARRDEHGASAATEERRLLGVGSSAWFGAALCFETIDFFP
jgi:hypothetical protein